jgi:hypothetical protein
MEQVPPVFPSQSGRANKRKREYQDQFNSPIGIPGSPEDVIDFTLPFYGWL